MEEFFKEWGLPIVFGAAVYYIFKPKNTGAPDDGQATNTGAGTNNTSGGNGSGASNQTTTYTYDCRLMSCVDSMSLGTNKNEVKYLKYAINWLRGNLMNNYWSDLSSSDQSYLSNLENSYPYLDPDNPNYNNNTANQVFGLTGLWGGSLIDMITAARHKVASMLSYSHPLVQEINLIISEMNETKFL